MFASAGCVTAAGLYARFVEPEWLEFVHHDLPLRGLPKELDGGVLAQLSDLHVGREVSSDYLRRTFDAVRARAPEFVVVTGDWVTYDGDMRFDELARVLESFPLGTLGTFGILGNHDYGSRWRHAPVAEAVSRRATDAGITMLRNEAAMVRGLTLIGVDDLWGPNFPPNCELLAGDAMVGREPIVLCHNPDAADEAIMRCHRGWMLAGHTHGGQCRPPFLPPPVLPVRNRRYTAGEFDLPGGRMLYINRGIGHLMPVRFNARPEVTLHRLQVAAA